MNKYRGVVLKRVFSDLPKNYFEEYANFKKFRDSLSMAKSSGIIEESIKGSQFFFAIYKNNKVILNVYFKYKTPYMGTLRS